MSESEKALASAERLARLMDERFGLPGTRIRLGLDGLMGLLPVVGDGASALIALYIVLQARRHGAPALVQWRMLGNIAVDTVLGSIPLVGDLFDIGFKSNRRNVELLRRHLQRRDGGGSSR